MRSADSFSEIYLYFEAVDMRKSINGLSALAQLEASADWKKDQLFVFVNKKRRLMKILYYDKTGFALWSKRLEEDKSPWEKFFKDKVSSVSAQDLDFILSGVNIFSKHQVKFYEHDNNKLLKKALFGESSERVEDLPDQYKLFNEAESLLQAPEKLIKIAGYTKKKGKQKKKAIS